MPSQGPANLSRIRLDTTIGMAFSNLVAFFIILTTAVTLHAHHVTDIQSSSQAASALKPIAGQFAFVLFSLGIIGTGLLKKDACASRLNCAMFPQVIDWIGRGLLEPEHVITHKIDFPQVAQAFEQMEQKPSESCKILLDFTAIHD